MSNIREELVKLLQDDPNSPVIEKLVSEVEENHPADLDRDSELFMGYGIFGGVALASYG